MTAPINYYYCRRYLNLHVLKMGNQSFLHSLKKNYAKTRNPTTTELTKFHRIQQIKLSNTHFIHTNLKYY